MKLKNLKTGFIATVFNEENNLSSFLDSLLNQSEKPDTIVIVDGMSTDNTVLMLRQYQQKFSPNNFKIIIKKGNRSVGRNLAIKNCNADIIAISDSGCVLEKNWLREIFLPFEKKGVDVVAGFYKGVYRNSFQKALIPYVLVMPEKANPKNFLPATRSMAIRKEVFLSIGGFDKSLSHNEDYEFARRLKKNKFNIIFAKKAIVKWIPPENVKSVFIMFFRFALGDMEAGIVRFKIILIFMRLIILLFFILSLIYNPNFIYVILFCLLLYSLYSYLKNKKYVSSFSQKLYLIFFQLLSDTAVISGSTVGLYHLMKRLFK